MRDPRSDAGAVPLRDGRRMAYTTAGPVTGAPVVYLHGLAGTPVPCSEPLERLLSDLDLRWIFVQRPGFGGSDPCRGRRIRDWPLDLVQVLDALELREVRLVGVSAGAPYAYAAAAALRERVASVAIVSGVARPTRRPLILSRLPARPLGAAGNAALRSASSLVPDACSRDAVLAGLESGAARAIAEDMRLVLSPWEIELGAVRCPVVLWHGALDRIVPARRLGRLAEALPDSRLRVCDGEGHFFFRRRVGEVLESLLGLEHVRSGALLSASPA